MRAAPLQTAEEIRLVKECLILAVLLEVLEHDIRALAATKLKMPRIYRLKVRSMQEEAARQLRSLQQAMKRHGIKVYDESRSKIHLQARYKCRGYEHEMILLWDVIRAEVEIWLGRCLSVNVEADEELL